MAEGEKAEEIEQPTTSQFTSNPNLKRKHSDSPLNSSESAAEKLFQDIKAVFEQQQPDFGQDEEGQYPCNQCDRIFGSEKMLSQHQQSFHTEKNFVCEICNKAFRFRSNLAEHRSVHTALKPFVCKFCGKSSRLKGKYKYLL